MFALLIIVISIVVLITLFATLAIRKLREPYRIPVFVGLAVLLFTPSLVPLIFVVIPIPFGILLYECAMGGFQQVMRWMARIWVWYAIAFPATGFVAYLIGRKIFYINKCPACKKHRRKPLGKHCKYCGTEFDFN